MSPLDTMNGLGGHSPQATQMVWIVAVSIGVALLVILAVLYRRASAQRELEEAERLIAERFGPE